jgi:ABC-type transport system involved in cytochrome bd biosynthesis fused ATPase/permease subunit
MKDASFTYGYKVQESDKSKEKGKKNLRVKIKLDESEDLVLDNVNLSMTKNNFTVVVGKVGCGKTSLLFSIMDETKHKRGSKNVQGSLAYVE